MTRYVAKNIVAAGLADECMIQVAYAIGVAEPVSLLVNTYGTGRLPDARLAAIVRNVVSFKPHAIIDRLKLRRPIYRKQAEFGPFGRNLAEFTWEKTDLVAKLKKAAR
jgi:S-adenosylmethionine synthetase